MIAFAIVALIGLILFAAGALMFLFAKPQRPLTTTLMALGGLLYAIGEGAMLIDLLL